jgi:hypothetical protein
MPMWVMSMLLKAQCRLLYLTRSTAIPFSHPPLPVLLSTC